jgi:hypothetical protein
VDREAVLKETTMASLGGMNVGTANIGESTYELPGGGSQHGLTAQLFLSEGDEDSQTVVVGAGSRLQLGAETWEVVAVTKEPGRRGRVRLRYVG